MKNYAILTSTGKRHAYFANRMLESFNVKLVIAEDKAQLEGRAADTENKFFANHSLPECSFIVPKGKVNSQKVHNLLRENDIDIALVFGTSILSNDTLQSVNEFMINIHTGLTQYYRGVDSAFWAIHNDDLDKIGVTLHKVNSGIDTGKILYQSVPFIQRNDNPDSLFMKLCKEGADLLSEKSEEIDACEFKDSFVKPTGTLYTTKDRTKIHEIYVEKTYRSRIMEYVSKNENS